MSSTVQPKPSLLHRIGHELRQYAIVSTYLFVCFGAVLVYKAAVLREAGINFAPLGFAAVKALILGKFMLIGQAVKLGERMKNRPLIYPTLTQSFLFLIFLLVLQTIEEALLGLLHGHTVAESIAALDAGRMFEIGATGLLMFLVLLPYFGIKQLGATLGRDRLRRLFFVDPRQPDATPQDSAIGT